jgi:hypothetical protein
MLKGFVNNSKTKEKMWVVKYLFHKPLESATKLEEGGGQSAEVA